jgi:CRP-like cAMP-binding protein
LASRAVALSCRIGHNSALPPADIGATTGSHEARLKHTIVDKVRMLRSVPLLSEVSTEVLADLAALSRVEDHAPGDVLFAEGEPADAFFLIIAGEVTAGRSGASPFTAQAGEELGALAVLDERPRVFTATTTTQTLLLRIGAEDFLYLIEQHPRLAQGVIRYLAHEVRSTIHGGGRYPLLPTE